MAFETGRNEFIAMLFSEYYTALRKDCIRYIRHDPKFLPLVDDCIQETFIKAYSNYDTLKTHPNIAGWLIIASRNYLMSVLRKHKYQNEHQVGLIDAAEFSEIDNGISAFERWICKNDMQDMIDKVYEVLSPKEKDILRDHFINNRTALETAELNGLTKGAIESGVRRIRKKIRKLFGKIIFFSIAQYVFVHLMHYTRWRG